MVAVTRFPLSRVLVSENLTVSRFSYPGHIEFLNRALGPVCRATSLGDLSVDSIAHAALRHEGKNSVSRSERDRLLGPEFDQMMGMLVRGDFPPLGRIQYRATLVSAAVNRIKLERYLEAGKPLGVIEAPIFVLGLPRTGTSLVQRLIAEDPCRRGLRTSELQSPISDEGPAFLKHLKRHAYGSLVSLVYRVFTPELTKIHHTSANSLEECWMLFMPSYSSLVADYLLPHRKFGDYLVHNGLFEAYGRYKKLLAILALESPDRNFVLKSPEHLWFLPALLHHFPDARVIWTHRDPVKALASYSAQVSLPARQHRGRIDPVEIGQRVLCRFQQGLQVGQETCERNPAARISHVHYSDLISDPLGAVARAYEDLDLELTESHRRAMQAFLNRPQRDKHKNRYRLDVFGFREDDVEPRFRDYRSRFGVESERGFEPAF